MPGNSRFSHEIDPLRADRYRGCLLAGAAGDALGAPVEFKDLHAIQQQFGPAGIRDFHPCYGRLGAITDDTQMTLFTAEGMLRAHVRGRLRGVVSHPGVVAHAYQRWLLTQHDGKGPADIGRDGWLFTHRELFSSRAPGMTCLSALAARHSAGDETPASNDSKGCGGVMRIAPVGLYASTIRCGVKRCFDWGCSIAALTHGHPTGQLAAGALAVIILELLDGRILSDAIQASKELLKIRPRHQETLTAIEAAEELATSVLAPSEAIPRLGEGWVAEEALAIALFCALRAQSLEEGLIMAVNITGDSDSTGAIAGNLLGASLGARGIPERWLKDLELKEVLIEMAEDLATVANWPLSEGGSLTQEEKREQEYWWERYPGW